MNRTRLAERVLWTLMTLLLSSVPSLAAATAEAGRIIAEENGPVANFLTLTLH